MARLVSLLPRRQALALGRSLGRLVADLDRRHVAIALDNLRRAFPHWDESRLRRTAHGVYAHFGQVLLDVLRLERRSRQEVLSTVEFVGLEHVLPLMEARRGILFATAHIGNWEIHGIAHSLRYRPISVIARALDNPLLDARLCAVRRMGGNTVLYKQKALQGVMRAIRAGEGVAILVDQNVQEKDGIFVEFFGRPAATTTVAAAVVVKTGCALVPVHTEIRRDGGYRLYYDAPLESRPAGERGAEVARLTQELSWTIEGWVRATPEQWLWMHRRWKTQPPPAALEVAAAREGVERVGAPA
jgi:KDO2-lipid IV(A) lauroyltransferase